MYSAGVSKRGHADICRMDDVEDNSELRRGSPVAHTIYGVPQTINTANYVYFQAVQELLQLQNHSDGHQAHGNGKGKAKAADTEDGEAVGSSDGRDLIGLVTGESRCFSLPTRSARADGLL